MITTVIICVLLALAAVALTLMTSAIFRTPKPSGRHTETGLDDTWAERLASPDFRNSFDHVSHAFGTVPRVMPAGAPPWPILPAGPDQGPIRNRQPDPAAQRYAAAPVGLDGGLLPLPPVTDAEVEQAKAELVEIFTRPGPARTVPDVPGTCHCGRPEGHVEDALINGTPGDIDRELATGTFQAVTE